MREEFLGQCQCGSVQYRVVGASATLFVCHCTDCQRQSASAFGMALWIRGAELSLLSGGTHEWVRSLPLGRRMSCRFCPACGTRLFHQVLGQGEFMSIKPGTLSKPLESEPVAHIWTVSKQPWVQIPAASLQYPGNPESFLDLFGEWEARACPTS